MKTQAVTKKTPSCAQAVAADLSARQKQRADENRATISAQLNNLPVDLSRGRILDAKAAASYWGVSLPHWRRLYRAGKVPAPIKIGDRKLGWKIGALADGLAQRAQAAA